MKVREPSLDWDVKALPGIGAGSSGKRFQGT